ncbi:MAG: AraC family transcriptional regulator [Bacteroidales bacterium]|nr:AraC family transcriptional regulator [Bacteroidales bacterium]
MKEVIKPTKPHKHDGYFEVIFLTDGAGVHIIDEHQYEVEPPVLFFMDPGHVHCWEFSKIPKGYVCIFKNEFLDDTPDIKHKFVKFDTMYNLKQGKINFLPDFELLKEEYDQQSPEPQILRAYLNVILWKITKLPINNTQHSTKHALVAGFRNLINENYYHQKEIGFYAEKLSVSKRTLSHVTKKETGRPATSLINERIVEESKRLLKHTTNSVSQIAYHLNFNDPSHFIKFFKSKTNLSPGEFRSKL